MATIEEPILSRLDRLDNILKQLEDIKGTNQSAKSSCASTPSSGTLTSDGQASSIESLEKHCRPMNDVIMETELKGTLIQRLIHVEDRVLKLEEELEVEKKKEKMLPEEKKPHKKGLKQLLKSFVKGKGRSKSKNHVT